LFEPNTVTTRHLIEDRIVKALATWEPRVQVEAVEVVSDPDDPQAAIVTITYRLVATQARERVNLSLTLNG
jgi:predicted component of type VI protein secretion system